MNDKTKKYKVVGVFLSSESSNHKLERLSTFSNLEAAFRKGHQHSGYDNHMVLILPAESRAIDFDDIFRDAIYDFSDFPVGEIGDLLESGDFETRLAELELEYEGGLRRNENITGVSECQ